MMNWKTAAVVAAVVVPAVAVLGILHWAGEAMEEDWIPMNEQVAALIKGETEDGGQTSEQRADDLISSPSPLTDRQPSPPSDETPVPPADEHPDSQIRADGKININTADASLLDQLPGIGPAKAQAIIDYRETHGPFASLEQLMKVKGIGMKTFEKLKEHISLN